jgi:peroxiredoxin
MMRILCLLLLAPLCAQSQEDGITKQIRGLRQLPDDARARVTRELALEIRRLPATAKKVGFATALANRATEGDFGHDTLQEVAVTLAGALKEQPAASAMPYETLAQIVRYEHVDVSLDAPQFAAAMSALEAAERRRRAADFTLVDLAGKTWTLRDLRGKVVLVNFWATWCQPCRKEMPDLEALYKRFKSQGLVVLAISDDDPDKVRRFAAQQQFTYSVMLDPGSKVNKLFEVEGIPKSFVYDRGGALVAQAIDMRTQKQFLEMLAQAGLRIE